jgi:hypothetical protein
MPAAIAKAVIDVKAKIRRIGKDADNKHGGYKYTSVDQFFEEVGHIMAEAGLFVILDEIDAHAETREATDSYGKSKVSNWLSCEYDVFLFHANGAQYGPIKRRIQVIASGPQAYGSAASYVEKYFLRSLLKIPTGEQDADADAQDGLPGGKRGKPADKWSGKEGANAREEEFESRKYYVSQSKARLSKIESVTALQTWWKDQKSIMEDMFDGTDDPFYADLKGYYAEHGKALRAKETKADSLAAKIGDDLPDSMRAA